jgi:hypothetical protein
MAKDNFEATIAMETAIIHALDIYKNLQALVRFSSSSLLEI